MSTKSRQRNEKRPKPNYSKDLQSGPYVYYIRQRPTPTFDVVEVITKGAFGKARIARKPRVPETVQTQEVTTGTQG